MCLLTTSATTMPALSLPDSWLNPTAPEVSRTRVMPSSSVMYVLIVWMGELGR